MFQFFRIILLIFGKNWLYVIAKGMRLLLACLFYYLLSARFFISQLFQWACPIPLSYTPVQEIVACAHCSGVQSLLMLFRFVWFLVFHCMEHCFLNDSGCSESIWRKVNRFVFYIFWYQVSRSWHILLHPQKKYWFLTFCTHFN